MNGDERSTPRTDLQIVLETLNTWLRGMPTKADFLSLDEHFAKQILDVARTLDSQGADVARIVRSVDPMMTMMNHISAQLKDVSGKLDDRHLMEERLAKMERRIDLLKEPAT